MNSSEEFSAQRQTYNKMMTTNLMESLGLPAAFSTTRTGGGRKPHHRPHGSLPDRHPAVRTYFDKRFPIPPGWPPPSGLPEPSKMYKSAAWQDPDLQICKKELNAVKNKLNNFDLAEWHRHTHHMNLAGEVVRALRQQFSPEFVTQAWCKFYEAASSFDLVPPSLDGDDFNSVHLCEAPGAFVTSLNHYLKLNRRVQWRWMSTTLNPYHEGNPLSCMINDDRFLLQTLDRWDFGRDFTGDLTDLTNMWHLVGRSRQMGDIHLVTADGSVDCQTDPGEQERLVSGLHFCETVAALHILAPGGSFLLKLFTTFEQETACLVYLLHNAFREVEFFKPATSREGNSEVYLICLGYCGALFLEPWLRELRRHYGKIPPEKAMFPRAEIPEHFMMALYQCANYFKDKQVQAIQRNIDTFKSNGRGEEEEAASGEESVRKMKLAVARHFVTKYHVSRLKDGDQVVGMDKLRQSVTLNMAPKIEVGTFSSNRSVRSLSPAERLREMCREVHTFHHLLPSYDGAARRFEDGGQVRWLKFSDSTRGRLSVVTGKRVDKVRSSKFCFGPLLCLRTKVLDLAWTLDLCPPREEPSARDLPERLGLADGVVLDFAGSSETSSPLPRALEALRNVPAGGNLLLLSFSTLTQLRAGLVYLLGHMFDRVGFVKPSKRWASIVFLGLRPRDESLWGHLEEACRVEESLRGDPSLAVLGVVAVNALCGRNCPRLMTTPSSSEEEEDGDLGSTFYDTVTHANNLSVREQIAEVAERVEDLFA